jgi:hypothetical protein
MFTYIRMGLMIATLFGGYFVYGVATNWLSEYGAANQKLAMCERDNRMLESRVKSWQLLKERRDEAIAASACKGQIEDWIKNPDEIPKPFNPFNQLH